MLQNKRRRGEECETSVRRGRRDSSEQLESRTQLDMHLGNGIRWHGYLPWWVGKLVHGSVFSGVVQRLEKAVEVEGHPFGG